MISLVEKEGQILTTRNIRVEILPYFYSNNITQWCLSMGQNCNVWGTQSNSKLGATLKFLFSTGISGLKEILLKRNNCRVEL